MKAHPYADLFPMMAEDELQALAADIKERGLCNPIVLLADEILDGRNRFLACLRAGITPVFIQYTGNDPLGYVLSQNLLRRHLNDGQRAMLANDLATMKKGRPVNSGIPPLSQKQAAAAVGVSPDSVKAARKVKLTGVPSLVSAVSAGTVSLAAAAAVSSLPQDVQTDVLKQGPDAVKAKASELRSNPRPGSCAVEQPQHRELHPSYNIFPAPELASPEQQKSLEQIVFRCGRQLGTARLVQVLAGLIDLELIQESWVDATSEEKVNAAVSKFVAMRDAIDEPSPHGLWSLARVHLDKIEDDDTQFGSVFQELAAYAMARQEKRYGIGGAK